MYIVYKAVRNVGASRTVMSTTVTTGWELRRVRVRDVGRQLSFDQYVTTIKRMSERNNRWV